VSLLDELDSEPVLSEVMLDELFDSLEDAIVVVSELELAELEELVLCVVWLELLDAAELDSVLVEVPPDGVVLVSLLLVVELPVFERVEEVVVLDGVPLAEVVSLVVAESVEAWLDPAEDSVVVDGVVVAPVVPGLVAVEPERVPVVPGSLVALELSSLDPLWLVDPP
jgi:hypothetical protein